MSTRLPLQNAPVFFSSFPSTQPLPFPHLVLVSFLTHKVRSCCSRSPPVSEDLTSLVLLKFIPVNRLWDRCSSRFTSRSDIMVELSVELLEKCKLSGTNYLNWKLQMESILQLKHLFRLVIQSESEDKKNCLDSTNPNRLADAYAIISLNWDPKIISQFSSEAQEDPSSTITPNLKQSKSKPYISIKSSPACSPLDH